MMETERLYIRPVEWSDAEDIFEYAKDSETGPMAGWPPHANIEATKEILARWLAEDCHEDVYAIVHKADNKVIGTIGTVHLNEHLKDEKNEYAKKCIADGNSVYEIGFALSKEYWNQGYGTETLRIMIGFLFDMANADVILTLHYEANTRSRRVQEKNNMRQVASYNRDAKWFNTDCTTMIVREKTIDEWDMENCID